MFLTLQTLNFRYVLIITIIVLGFWDQVHFVALAIVQLSVDQAGLELIEILPISARTKGVYHHAQPTYLLLYVNSVCVSVEVRG